jgi:hypothetical protein
MAMQYLRPAGRGDAAGGIAIPWLRSFPEPLLNQRDLLGYRLERRPDSAVHTFQSAVQTSHLKIQTLFEFRLGEPETSQCVAHFPLGLAPDPTH